MKKALIVGAIIVAALIVIGGITFALAPQSLMDFFMAFGAEIHIEIDGERHTIKFSKLEDGLETPDRVFLFKKVTAFAVSKGSELERAQDEYIAALLKAADDRLLTNEEYKFLKEMHSDIMPKDRVDNWFADVLKKDRNRE